MSDDEYRNEMIKETPCVTDGGKPLITRIYGALSHHRRRRVLYYLSDHEPATIDDLAVQLAAWEQDIPRDEISDDDVKKIRTELVHTHLPKLEDQGLVEYDPRTETVVYAYPPTLLEEVIDLSATLENSS